MGGKTVLRPGGCHIELRTGGDPETLPESRRPEAAPPRSGGSRSRWPEQDGAGGIFEVLGIRFAAVVRFVLKMINAGRAAVAVISAGWHTALRRAKAAAVGGR